MPDRLGGGSFKKVMSPIAIVSVPHCELLFPRKPRSCIICKFCKVFLPPFKEKEPNVNKWWRWAWVLRAQTLRSDEVNLARVSIMLRSPLLPKKTQEKTKKDQEEDLEKRRRTRRRGKK